MGISEGSIFNGRGNHAALGMVSPCSACWATKLQRQNRARAIQRQQIAAIKEDSHVNTINQARNCCEKIIFFNGRGHHIALGSFTVPIDEIATPETDAFDSGAAAFCNKRGQLNIHIQLSIEQRRTAGQHAGDETTNVQN